MSGTFPVTPATQVECVQGVPVISILGRLDTSSAPVFDTQADEVMKDGCSRILVDLSGITYISSAGLRSILRLIKHTSKHGGRTGIFGAPAQVMEVFDISGFRPLLDVYPDRESALQGGSA